MKPLGRRGILTALLATALAHGGAAAAQGISSQNLTLCGRTLRFEHDDTGGTMLAGFDTPRIALGTGRVEVERVDVPGAVALVVRSVRDVGELIRQITNATHEQSIGIAQVNEAVTQLDTVTQQNAALVEESAASAEGLSNSAVTLARAVQVFHLP